LYRVYGSNDQHVDVLPSPKGDHGLSLSVSILVNSICVRESIRIVLKLGRK